MSMDGTLRSFRPEVLSGKFIAKTRLPAFARLTSYNDRNEAVSRLPARGTDQSGCFFAAITCGKCTPRLPPKFSNLRFW